MVLQTAGIRHDDYLAPCAPQWSAIVRVRFRCVATANRALFSVLQALERAKAEAGGGRICCDAERPPEESYGRKVQISSWGPDLERMTVHWAAGEVLQGCRALLRAET